MCPQDPMRGPISITKIIPELLKEFGLDKKARTYDVITHWEEMVGPKIAAVTRAEKLERGILTVRVTDAVWRYELTLHSAGILRKIAERYGANVVTEIQWKL